MPRFITDFDPAAYGTFDAAQILYATCAMLLNYPDEPGAAGLRLIPEAARALPTVSTDGRTYTFVIRPGMRFSPPSNQLVTAQTFKYTIERSLSPPRATDGFGQGLLGDVVGAKAYFAKKARHITGVQARGDRLTIRLTQPALDLPTRIAQTPFCAVPTDMPLRPARGAIPSPGPTTSPRRLPGGDSCCCAIPTTTAIGPGGSIASTSSSEPQTSPSPQPKQAESTTRSTALSQLKTHASDAFTVRAASQRVTASSATSCIVNPRSTRST